MPVLLHDVKEPVEEMLPVGNPEELVDEAVGAGVPIERVHRDPRVQSSYLARIELKEKDEYFAAVRTPSRSESSAANLDPKIFLTNPHSSEMNAKI